MNEEKESLPDRIAFLRSLSGLEVQVRKDNKGSVFEFLSGGQTLTAFYTYPKARAFAEGVKFGREHK